MRKTVTLWANTPDDLSSLGDALQQEFGSQAFLAQGPKPVVWENTGEDHERYVGYTDRVTEDDLANNPSLRYIAKIDVETEDGNYTLTARMKNAVAAVSEGREEAIVNAHSVALGRKNAAATQEAVVEEPAATLPVNRFHPRPEVDDSGALTASL